MLTVTEVFQDVPSYAVTPLTDLPLLYQPEHLYPYTSYHETATEPAPRRMQFLRLENEALRVLVAPELGGRVWSLFDRRLGREILFHNPVVRPTRILPVWAYISGGIEFNFPIAHSPTSIHTVGSAMGQEDDYAWIRVGEREARSGMEWVVEIGLVRGSPMLIQRTALRNPTAEAHPWMMWSNCAVRSTPGTEFVYPPGEVLVHGDTTEKAMWPAGGLNWEKNISRMVGVFWSGGQGDRFGVFHHDLGLGLLHVADPSLVPGKKLWSYGSGRHRRWGVLTTRGDTSYAEIQSGPLTDQNQKPLFPPQTELRFEEYWIPVHDRAAMEAPIISPRDLPQMNEPYLGYTHSSYQYAWERFIAGQGPLPASAVPPGLDVESALRREVDRRNVAAREPLAIYLAFHKRPAEARAILMDPQTPSVCRILGLILWRGLARPAEAVDSLRRGPLNDPVALVELDQLYEQLGMNSERETLLRSAPPHRLVIERRANLALAQGRPEEMLHFLNSVHWPLEHQRYVRTELWKSARKQLGLADEPVPEHLGEDDLAAFGAYWSE